MKHARGTGEILLAQPISTTWFAWLALLIGAGIAASLAFVDYTRKERVTGQLSLDKGLVKIYPPPVSGFLLKKLVKDGELVQEGQALFVISVERVSVGRGETQAEILKRIAERKKYLQQERDKQETVMTREETTLVQRIGFLQQEIKLLQQEMETQQRQLKLGQQNLARNKELMKEEFVSQARIDEIEQRVLDLQLKIQTAERNQTSMNKELSQLKDDVRNMPLTRQNRLSEFDRQILAMEQEITDTESRRELQVNAPQAGRMTTLLAELGQAVTADKPLAVILPEKSRLMATIYLPSRAYGFVEKAQSVLLRYPAYPYQKFGQYGGKVIEIGRSALSAAEMETLGQSPTEPYYRVLLELDSQSVQAYGKSIVLQEGMQVEADILIDTRKLYEWVLEPLYSVTGKI